MALSAQRSASALLCAAAVSLASAHTRADDTTAARRAGAAREQGLPYMMAEFSAGFLALPAAEVCLKTLTDCSRGELSLALGLHNLYRLKAFGIGAGIQWATTVRNDAAPGAPALQRTHARRYFLVDAEARYYFSIGRSWEWYTGATVGGVIVNDSWSENADRNPPADTSFIGPRAATIGTEGFAIGVGAGGEWSFARNWSFGLRLRYSNWILPTKRAVSPTLDVASLSGRLDVVDLGLQFAYRIAL